MMILKDVQGDVILWNLNRFPDKQVQFKILNEFVPLVESLDVSLQTSGDVDIFLQALHCLKPKVININYFYGSRCDKDFTDLYKVANVSHMLDNILATLVDWASQTVTILGPHHKGAWGKSDYTSVINKVVLRNFDQVIFPDHSAAQRFAGSAVASYRQTTCTKKRDQDTGKIVSYEVPIKFLNSELPAQNLIVVDDLCDGGRTFLELAKQINRKHSLTLFVIHGVFSGNALPDLLKYYNKIIVSNSLGKYSVLSGKVELESVNALDKALQSRIEVIDVWNLPQQQLVPRN